MYKNVECPQLLSTLSLENYEGKYAYGGRWIGFVLCVCVWRGGGGRLIKVMLA